MLKSLSFSGAVVFDYCADGASPRQRAARVFERLADPTLPRPPVERHSLLAAPQAHERLESRRSSGALVLMAL